MIDRIHPCGSPRTGLLLLSSLAIGLSCGKADSAQRVHTRSPSFRDGYLIECLQACDDGNPCTTDLCNYKTGTCYTELAADGLACDDGNPCTLGDACVAGTCRGTDKDCSNPPDPCHEAGYCLPASGSCSYPISTDGKTCNDNNVCTSGEYCQQGKCSGVALQCRPPAACGVDDGICRQNGAVAFPSPLWGLALDGGIDAISGYLPAMALSPSGTIFLTGAFKGTLDLGSGPVASVGDDDVFITRLSPEDGKASWLRPYGDRFGQRGVAVAANGEVVLAAGVFLGTMDFGLIDGAPTTYTNTASSPMGYLIAQNEKDGQPLWVQTFDLLQTGSVLATAMMRVAADPTDSSFVICGLANKAVNGLGAPMPAAGKADILVAKVDGLTKNVRWARQIGSNGDDECHGLIVDSRGSIYMTGRYSGSGGLDFGNGYSLPASSTAAQISGFVAKLDKQGSTLWANRIVPKANGAKVSPEAIVTDGDSLWIGGAFQKGAGFDETSLTPPDSASSAFDSAFVANYASDGSLLWAKNWGSRARVLGLSLPPTGELLVAGDYASNMKFDSGDLQDSPGSNQAFFARMKASTGVVTAARGYARGTADQSKSFFFAMASAPSQLASLPSASYLLGSFDVSLPLGAPLASLDVGTASGSRILLAKIAP